MQAPRLEFWYDFASTYSYLSAMRIETVAKAHGVKIDWKPFLLGPIFRSQGWDTSPFNVYPAKGRYMWRDMQRLTAERGLSFSVPSPFPQNSLAAARLALVASDRDLIAPVTKAIFTAQFGHGHDIGDATVLQHATTRACVGRSLDSAQMLTLSVDPKIKDRLKAQTAAATSHGIFGAPTFRTQDGELFWGDDRLDQAMAWARAQAIGE